MNIEHELLAEASKATAHVDAKEEPATPEEGEQAEAEPQVEQKPLEIQEDEKPIGEMLGQKEEPVGEPEEEDDEEPKEEMVPKATLLKVKRDLKDEIRQLKSKAKFDDIEEVAESVAEKYDLQPEFVKDLLGESVGVFEKKFKKELDEIKNAGLVKEVEQKKNQLFDGIYDNLLTKNPELKDIVNKEFVRREALNPANSKKTIKEIVKDIYGGAIQKRAPSFDGYSPSKQEPEPENILNPDAKEMGEIAKNPKLRAKFGDELAKKVNW